MNTQAQGATAPTVFQFQDSAPLRVETDEQGNPWFLAKDVCDILGYENHNKAVKDHCKQDGVTKRYPILDTLGRTQYPLFVSEGNLYRLIIKSNKPEAESFETWVCDIVLPAIRKTGRYVHPAANTHAAEYLTSQDLCNIKRVIWDISRYQRYESSWVQGVWLALRTATRNPSPHPFTVDHLPLIAEELRRVLNAAEKLRDHTHKLEQEVIKTVIRGGGSIDAIIAREEADQAATLAEMTQGATSVLDGWQIRELNAIAARTATTHGDYRGMAET